MGTRADFYVGRGKNAEWIGSIALDGYWDGIDLPILQASDEPKFRLLVAKFIDSRADGTKPEQGWPWPWDDSGTTDCAYAFDKDCVWQAHHTGHWVPAWYDYDYDCPPPNAVPIEWPDMRACKNVALGDRSGLLIFGVRR